MEPVKLELASDREDRGRFGVIDVGSNSVRLVVYSGEMRVPFTVFNEKVLCGLGRDLRKTGRLHPKGMKLALDTTKRFVDIAREMGVGRLDMVATAAVREATDGARFIEKVTRRCNHPLRPISGEEEAMYGGEGVLAGFLDPEGVAGDLGGGSLELVHIADRAIDHTATLPVGPLRLHDVWRKKPDKTVRDIRTYLKDLPWLRLAENRNFYAIGGNWRAIANLHMAHRGYPLPIIHGYTVRRSEIRDFLETVSRMSRRSLQASGAIPVQRIDTVPLAAKILGQILDIGKPKHLVLSALGLREGLLFSRLPQEIKEHDPLIEECRAIGAAQGRFELHGEELYGWIAPLFAEEDGKSSRLRRAACLLSDIGWRGHPSQRAELVFYQILYSWFVGLGHDERVALAYALYVCYGGSIRSRVPFPLERMITEEQMDWAERVGYALRLAQRFSGGTAEVLDRCTLRLKEDRIDLRVGKESAHLAGEVVERRLQAVGEAFGKKTKVVVA